MLGLIGGLLGGNPSDQSGAEVGLAISVGGRLPVHRYPDRPVLRYGLLGQISGGSSLSQSRSGAFSPSCHILRSTDSIPVTAFHVSSSLTMLSTVKLRISLSIAANLRHSKTTCSGISSAFMHSGQTRDQTKTGHLPFAASSHTWCYIANEYVLTAIRAFLAILRR